MKINKNTCSHPGNRRASYTDKTTNTYYERCLKCTKTLQTRKFVKENTIVKENTTYIIGVDLARKEA